ncbi:hypothetical protein F0Q45_20025 [Mycobacterium simiae]|uniref:Uncharacterized protein n=1 Tax=Mycobacterium simiae TaxID=1784 RepID=A0A5B1BJJ3_MYCSI|nr:hypothetical protein [Mycobacterium simiae]KAA1248546.1 hypothetical protein F0Q45_20025 [Mycobacterium simiae]
MADPGTEGLARLGDDGVLIVSPLPAEQLPAKADTLAEATSARLPKVQLPALLIEVDQRTRFSEQFTHAGSHNHATQTSPATCTRRSSPTRASRTIGRPRNALVLTGSGSAA